MLMEEEENQKKILKYDHHQEESDENQNQSNDWRKDENYYFKKAIFHYPISNDHNFVEGTYNLGLKKEKLREIGREIGNICYVFYEI